MGSVDDLFKEMNAQLAELDAQMKTAYGDAWVPVGPVLKPGEPVDQIGPPIVSTTTITVSGGKGGGGGGVSIAGPSYVDWSDGGIGQLEGSGPTGTWPSQWIIPPAMPTPTGTGYPILPAPYIPAPPSVPAPDWSGTIWQLQNDVNALLNRIEKLEAIAAGLKEQNEKLEGENLKLKTELEDRFAGIDLD